MSEQRERPAVQRILGLVARHLEDYFDGDDLALEALGAALDEGEFSPDEMEIAVLALRGVAGDRLGPAEESPADPPGRLSLRVPSAEERDTLSPEAWGYLLDLRRRGSLDPAQFERVLGRLADSGIRPIGVDLAHEVAVRVALSESVPTSDHWGAGEDVAH